MATLREMLRQARADGYLDENAEAKVCQDIKSTAATLLSPVSRLSVA